MPSDDLAILPTTKVSSLLDRYPELEDVLIQLAPPFVRLKNPLLRRGVARVASLKQAAAVGHLPVSRLVNTLRGAVGQPAIPDDDSDERSAYFSAQPDWFDAARVIHTVDESSTDPDKMPIAELLQRAMLLNPGEILELRSQHLPAPGIDILKSKGYRVWSTPSTSNVVHTFLCKP
jgi:hypothetical protein